jgi:hypothetical protein
MGSGQDFSFYHWPYPELPGTKPEFYQKELLSAFTQDGENLPFQYRETEISYTGSVTLDLRPLRSDKKNEAPVLKRLPIEIAEDERPIKGFEYWGPFRYRSFGILALSYGIEGI